ncbi:uncharacterized protein BJ171DRAFT_540866 [Polychytrium aggregatum]|uniref:uncharacterized protein n=1 Tax=Polychytrium aggregatum TaxID=110093 RepID=UPI0022FF15B3|nr:uncharacterized protein BJ171DRAFT_540866 [Polychytrium aggregatum]KAI9190758.1 hypothetical protein BJ171DRAFT_540866 [Polychytrium aggregatum]
MSDADLVDRDFHREHEGLAYHGHWYNIPCKAIMIPNQKVVVINGETPVERACEVLIQNGIISAPVWDESRKQFVGMFDYRDIVTYVLLSLKREINPDNESYEFQELLRLARAQKPIPAKLAADLSQKNPFFSVMGETPLSQLVDVFGKGVHRVAVMSDGLAGIISQSTLLKYLWNNASKYAELQQIFKKTLKELGLGAKTVISVPADLSVIEALRIMVNSDISSVAILNPRGAIVANLSMTDIKWLMRAERFPMLWESCIKFVSFVDQQQGIADGRDKTPVFDVTESSTLEHTIGKLISTRAHRVWVVEKTHNHVVSVVSLTDILRVLTPPE